MALGANGLGKEILLRRIVHVDIVLVGKNKFDSAERVVAAGRLENFDTADVDASPIERGRVHLVTTVIDMQIVPFEYGGIPAKQATALSEVR